MGLVEGRTIFKCKGMDTDFKEIRMCCNDLVEGVPVQSLYGIQTIDRFWPRVSLGKPDNDGDFRQGGRSAEDGVGDRLPK